MFHHRAHCRTGLHFLGEGGLVDNGERVRLLRGVHVEQLIRAAVGGIEERVPDALHVGAADVAPPPVDTRDLCFIEGPAGDHPQDGVDGDDHATHTPANGEGIAFDDVCERGEAVRPAREKHGDAEQRDDRDPGHERLEFGGGAKRDGERERADGGRPRREEAPGDDAEGPRRAERDGR